MSPKRIKELRNLNTKSDINPLYVGNTEVYTKRHSKKKREEGDEVSVYNPTNYNKM